MEVFLQSHARDKVNIECFLSDVGSKSYIQIPTQLLQPLTTRVRKYFILEIDWDEVTVIITGLLNPMNWQ